MGVRRSLLLVAAALFAAGGIAHAQPEALKLDSDEGDFVVRDFKFQTGESFPELLKETGP